MAAVPAAVPVPCGLDENGVHPADWRVALFATASLAVSTSSTMMSPATAPAGIGGVDVPVPAVYVPAAI